MSCQARILNECCTFPGSTEIYHTTKECGKPEYRKISVDDGEGTMIICTACYPRYKNMVKKPETWYGWFDGEYPPESRVMWSTWYNTVRYNLSVAKLVPGVKIEKQFSQLSVN